jgi:hypothetical protein
MKERPVDLERAVIAHDQAPVVPQPADGAFDDPATPIPLNCCSLQMSSSVATRSSCQSQAQSCARLFTSGSSFVRT